MVVYIYLYIYNTIPNAYIFHIFDVIFSYSLFFINTSLSVGVGGMGYAWAVRRSRIMTSQIIYPDTRLRLLRPRTGFETRVNKSYTRQVGIHLRNCT